MTDNTKSPYPSSNSQHSALSDVADNAVSCCPGTPSGYIEPDGTAALMCDDECTCGECQCQR